MGDLQIRDQNREKLRKEYPAIAEAQNSMCEAISGGNINQIGWNAWASMIDQARELVLDVVNDMKVDPRNSSIVANGLDQEISHKKTDLDKYKDERGFGPQDDDENLRSDPVYMAKVEELEKYKTYYDTRVNKNTYPHLMNDTVPTEIYSITYNNSWDMSFGYMTTCIKCNDLEIWYDLASADPNKVSEIRIDHKKCKNAKESLRTLADCFNHPSYYTCSGDEGHTCPLPNCKKNARHCSCHHC